MIEHRVSSNILKVTFFWDTLHTCRRGKERKSRKMRKMSRRAKRRGRGEYLIVLLEEQKLGAEMVVIFQLCP